MSLFQAIFIVGGRIKYFLSNLLRFLMGVFMGLAVLRLQEPNFDLSISRTLWLIGVGLVVMVIAHYAGVHVNILADYEMDKQFKSQLSRSVEIIGRRRLSWLIVAWSLAGTILILYLAIFVSKWIIVILWAIGLAAAITYSAEPFRFKKYLFWGDIARLVAMTVPLIFGYWLFAPNYHSILVFGYLGLAVTLFGLFMFGEVWDWKDDEGVVSTFATSFGYKTALIMGGIIIPTGILVWLFGFAIFRQLDAPMVIYLIVGIILLGVFLNQYYLKLYSKRNDYWAIEEYCGFATKFWTTTFWAFLTIGSAILFWGY